METGRASEQMYCILKHLMFSWSLQGQPHIELARIIEPRSDMNMGNGGQILLNQDGGSWVVVPAKACDKLFWTQLPPEHPGANLNLEVLPNCRQMPSEKVQSFLSSIGVQLLPGSELEPTNCISVLSRLNFSLFALITSAHYFLLTQIQVFLNSSTHSAKFRVVF